MAIGEVINIAVSTAGTVNLKSANHTVIQRISAIHTTEATVSNVLLVWSTPANDVVVSTKSSDSNPATFKSAVWDGLRIYPSIGTNADGFYVCAASESGGTYTRDNVNCFAEGVVISDLITEPEASELVSGIPFSAHGESSAEGMILFMPSADTECIVTNFCVWSDVASSALLFKQYDLDMYPIESLILPAASTFLNFTDNSKMRVGVSALGKMLRCALGDNTQYYGIMFFDSSMNISHGYAAWNGIYTKV